MWLCVSFKFHSQWPIQQLSKYPSVDAHFFDSKKN